jgi:hypothetical protein
MPLWGPDMDKQNFIHNNNSVASVRERTIPTQRPPLVSEVNTNFLQIKGATWSAWRIPMAVFSDF